MADISRLPANLQPLARRIDADGSVSGSNANDGRVRLSELEAAQARGLFTQDELGDAAELAQNLSLLGRASTWAPPSPTAAPRPFEPWQQTSGATSGNTQTVDALRGAQLQAGKPVEVPGLDASRPIAYVEARTQSGESVTVNVGREAQRSRPDGSSANWGFEQPVFGPVMLSGSGTLSEVTVHYADSAEQGYSDYYSIPVGKDGIKHGGALELPIPPARQGMEIENIDVSFHAPVRQWNEQTDREEKPTYVNWYTGASHLGRKFVDPNADSGNAPEIDNVHGANANGSAVLAKADKTLRIVAENPHIPADEDAMSVQWVRVSYRPQNAEVKQFSFKGKPLPNQEWEGEWIQPRQRLSLEVDPSRKIQRVEVQWSDKPDDVGYNEPGKWATGSLKLDGKPLGVQNEHVGSPEWQVFDNLRGAQGQKLEIEASSSPLKVFEVKVYYAD